MNSNHIFHNLVFDEPTRTPSSTDVDHKMSTAYITQTFHGKLLSRLRHRRENMIHKTDYTMSRKREYSEAMES